MNLSDPRRQFLLSLLTGALEAVNGRLRMRAALAPPQPASTTSILAVGKAASAMTLGALDALGPAVRRALVISRSGHFDAELQRQAVVSCLTGGHPVPDAGSLVAGAAALEFLRTTAAGERLLLLVSGGASSLMEVPRAGVSLADLVRFNEWALASGQPIDEVNAQRCELSAIKGGRLLQQVGGARPEGYAISDVPGDDLAVIGSGLLAAPGLPARVVGCLDEALTAAMRRANTAGVPAVRVPGRLMGEACEAGARLCGHLRDPAAVVYIAGGETTVRLPPQPGRGGRNQHLALAAARQLAGDPELLLLAVGTDGTDGNTDDAGALVDGGTLSRAALDGLDADDHLRRADSGRFLAASRDLVHTGPTGTNVGDIIFAMRCAVGHSPPGGNKM